jgi:hypothetical protein
LNRLIRRRSSPLLPSRFVMRFSRSNCAQKSVRAR